MLSLKDWKEKKKELDDLNQNLNQPKIKSGDASGVVTVVKKLMSDPMIAVSDSAIKVCGSLAKALKKDFEQGVKDLLVTLLLRFKEKKTMIVDNTHIALEAFMQCVSIEVLKEDLISTGLQEKAPSVLQNSCTFLEKLVQKTYIDVLQKVSGDFLAQLMKMSEDPDGDVRNSALSCLGIFKGRLGDSAMSNYLKDMLAQKLAKVNDSAKNVQPSKYDRPEVKVVAPPQASKAAAAPQAPPKKALAAKTKVNTT